MGYWVFKCLIVWVVCVWDSYQFNRIEFTVTILVIIFFLLQLDFEYWAQFSKEIAPANRKWVDCLFVLVLILFSGCFSTIFFVKKFVYGSSISWHAIGIYLNSRNIYINIYWKKIVNKDSFATFSILFQRYKVVLTNDFLACLLVTLNCCEIHSLRCLYIAWTFDIPNQNRCFKHSNSKACAKYEK